VYHWSLALLLVVVWLATAFVTSQLLASDMRLLRRVCVLLGHLVRAMSPEDGYSRSSYNLILAPSYAEEDNKATAYKRLPCVYAMQFPETPMPAPL